MLRHLAIILLAIALCTSSLLGEGRAEVALAAAKIPDSFVHPLISAPADGAFPCLPENPSCGRDDWYEEWDQNQSRELGQYDFVGPGLVSERRFAEPIRLLWQWPVGRDLLQRAAAHSVVIRADSYRRRQGYAYWAPADHEVTINLHYADVSTWMLTSVIGHELRHSIDPRMEADYDATPDECFDAELVAHQLEQQYVRWIANRFGGLPTRKQMKFISKDDLDLYENLSEIAATDDLVAFLGDMYAEQCATG